MNKKSNYELLMEINKLEMIRRIYEDKWVYSHQAVTHFINQGIDEAAWELEKRYNALPAEEREKYLSIEDC